MRFRRHGKHTKRGNETILLKNENYAFDRNTFKVNENTIGSCKISFSRKSLQRKHNRK